jgi:hypothetical protein
VDEVIDSYPDKMPKAIEMQQTTRKVASYYKSGLNSEKMIDSIVVTKAIPGFLAGAKGFGTQKLGWSVSYAAGDFGDDMMARDIINYGGLWANVVSEAIYFVGLTDSNKQPLSGSKTYEIRFPKDGLPDSMVHAFWSVTLYSVPDYLVVNNPLKKYNVNNVDGLKNNDDGSMSVWLCSTMPKGIPQANWLPTPKGKAFALTMRMYVSKPDVLSGRWFPAPIEKKSP